MEIQITEANKRAECCSTSALKDGLSLDWFDPNFHLQRQSKQKHKSNSIMSLSPSYTQNEEFKKYVPRKTPNANNSNKRTLKQFAPDLTSQRAQ